MKLPSLELLILNTTATLKRFLLAIIAAIAGSSYSISLAHQSYDHSFNFYVNIIKSCYLGMLLFIAISIYSETKKVNNRTSIILNLAGIAVIICYYISLPSQFMTISLTRFALFTVALHLLIAFIPFLGKNEVNGFWQYNKILFLRILTSTLYTVVLYLGLVLAILAIDKLFNADVDNKIYFDLWILLTGIFNTWFFLAGVPANFSELESKKDYPKGLKIFTQYVLIPLISIYLLILYAYMFKIIINAQWPVGWVSYLVIGFSIGGIFSLLLIYPIRNDENNRWILIFSRFFYYALFPLIILLFFAVKRRVSEYGITEKRYFIIILALWLLLIAVYFLFSRAKNIKLIPVSLCILAMVASFGPWSAFSVSFASQNKHLKSLLAKYSMVEDGKFIKAKDTIPFKDHKQISSIVNYLVSVHGYKTLQPYFSQNLDSVFKNYTTNYYDYDNSKVSRILSLLNINYIGDYQTEEDKDIATNVSYYSDEKDDITIIKGYDYLISDFSVNGYQKEDTSCKSYRMDKNNISICFNYTTKQLSIYNKIDSALTFDVYSFISSLKKYERGHSIPLAEMTLTSGNSLLQAKIIFDNIHFQNQKDSIEQLGFTSTIFIKGN